MMNLPNDDNSPLDPSVDPVAHAAMKKEWAEISHLFLGDMSAVDEAELIQRSQIFTDFQTRHLAVFQALQTPPSLLDLTELPNCTAEFAQSVIAVDAAEEDLLQNTAALAEARSDLQVSLLSILGSLENVTPEEWSQMEESQRVGTLDSLLSLRAAKESMLSQLPLEMRRQMERELDEAGAD